MASTSSATPSSAPSASGRRPWRRYLLWVVFALTIAIGLVLAIVYGADAPILLEQATP